MSKLLNAKVGDDLITFNQPIEKIEKTSDYGTITAYKCGHIVSIQGDFTLKTLSEWTTITLAQGFPKAKQVSYNNVWLAHNLDNMLHNAIAAQIDTGGNLTLTNWGQIKYENAIALRFTLTYISAE